MGLKISRVRSHRRNLGRISYLWTAILGPEYQPSHELIEIDVTYRCNLKCIGCNRSCRQASDETRLSPAQLGKFIDESITTGRIWKRIRVLGGEPTTHPDILQMLGSLVEYKGRYNPEVQLEIVSNGFGEEAAAIISNIPKEVIVTNTHKTSVTANRFEDFNLAPQDDARHAFTDFRNGCWITEECGLGLTPFGYYHCAVAGGIDRVVGYDLGLKHLPSIERDYGAMTHQMRRLCRWCGHFQSGEKVHTRERRLISELSYSSSWAEAYEQYKAQKPELDMY